MTGEVKYERPLATVDVAIVALIDGSLKVLLQRRPKSPFEGSWALPGGWIRTNEDRDTSDAARRILGDKLGIDALHMEQLATYSSPDRDPRGWSLSVCYLALVPPHALDHILSEDTAFFPMSLGARPGELAFDHDHIVNDAMSRIVAKASYSLLPAALIGETFTLPELKAAYDAILDRDAPLNRGTFHRKFASMDLLVECGSRTTTRKPATLYRLADGVRTFERPLVDIG